MGRKKQVADAALSLTPRRAGRLYRLLTQLGSGPQTRAALLRRLKLDVRGFYRDLEVLRQLDIVVTTDQTKYVLAGGVDDALSRLPFPDPGLNLREVMQLSSGTTAAHRKLRKRLDEFLGPPPKSGAR